MEVLSIAWFSYLFFTMAGAIIKQLVCKRWARSRLHAGGGYQYYDISDSLRNGLEFL
jgi:hypothetical protein